MGTEDAALEKKDVPQPKRQKFGLDTSQGQRSSFNDVPGLRNKPIAAASGLTRVPGKTLLSSGTRLPLQALPRRPPAGSIVGIMRPPNRLPAVKGPLDANSSALATGGHLKTDSSSKGLSGAAPKAGGFLAKLSARATPGGAAATTVRKRNFPGASSTGFASGSSLKPQQKVETRVIKCLQKPSQPLKGGQLSTSAPAQSAQPTLAAFGVGKSSTRAAEPLDPPASGAARAVAASKPAGAAPSAPAAAVTPSAPQAVATSTSHSIASEADEAGPEVCAELPTSQLPPATAPSTSPATAAPPVAHASDSSDPTESGDLAPTEAGKVGEEEADGVDEVAESGWREVEAAVDGKADIRRFFSVKTMPPPIKCPLLPTLPLAKPVAARFWRHLMRSYQTDGQRALTRAAALRLVWGRLGVLPSTLDSATGSMSLAADPASWLEFDALGSLLAVGTLNGVLRIYDFDEYVASLSCCRTDYAEPSGAARPTQPIQVLYPKRGVSMMRWHPDASAELAVAFSHFNQVYVYDLEAWSTEPTRVYEVGHRAKGSAGGNVSLTFARHAPQRGGGCFMVAGSTYGMLRCWDMRRTDRLYWEVKLRSSQAISAVASSGQYLVASCSDYLTIWDTHRLQVPCMGAEPSPTLLWTLENVGTVQSLWARQPPVPCVLAVTSAAQLLRIDVSIGKVVGRRTIGPRPTNGRVDTACLGRVMGTDVALVCDHDNALDVCLHELQPCLEAMAGDGDSGQRLRFRRPAQCDEEELTRGHYRLTLPGLVTEAVEGESWVQSTCLTLHHYLAPKRGSATFKARRASSIMIDRMIYDIEDVEVSAGGTRVHLTRAFYRSVVSDGPGSGVIIQAPLEPEDYHVPGAAVSVRRPECLLKLPSPLVASALNPNSTHIVAGLADGSLAVLGVGDRQDEPEVESAESEPN